MEEGRFDYVIAGAGSSGCALASRLVNAGKRVLLVEAGPADDTRFIDMPATFAKVIGTARSWIYESEPEAGLGGRRVPIPQGRTLGGGSSINAMVYMRGQPEDYDGWRDLGCPGWGWADVLPVFRRLERNERLAEPLHGRPVIATTTTSTASGRKASAFTRRRRRTARASRRRKCSCDRSPATPICVSSPTRWSAPSFWRTVPRAAFPTSPPTAPPTPPAPTRR